nr:zinc finger CCCH domain-containing protein 3 [Nomia melanderi]
MDQSLLKEIHYLTSLIEHHKKKSIEKSCCVKETFLNPHLGFTKSLNYTNLVHKYQPSYSNHNNTSHNEVTTTNVYINPNFKPQNSSIHINPRLQETSLVHVNPKMMKSVINSNKNVKTDSISKATSTEDNFLQNQNSLKKSVHVNPKLMKKLSSSIQPKSVKPEETVIQNVNHPVCSRLKLVKNVTSLKNIHSPRKTNNSNIVLLSQRKLVRVRRNSKKSLSTPQTEFHKIKKSLNVIKNIKFSSYKTVKTKTGLLQSVNKDASSTKSLTVKSKINKYRIDRTVPKTISIKEHSNQTQKKVMNKKMELITIGGIVYKSSKNQLVRKSYGVKKKRITNIKSDKFIVATNGKKLCRIKPLKETLENSRMKILNKTNGTKLSSNLSQKINYKTNISNKVKQRSIQILRNKMQKNNQPCLIFQRFGYCSNHEKGICLKRHDKKQISLCKKFLQGNCLLDKCPLSHDVGPEKMPTCKYFLEGCCTRDGCPYRHIKVSSSTPICREFLQGYCAKGQEVVLTFIYIIIYSKEFSRVHDNNFYYFV